MNNEMRQLLLALVAELPWLNGIQDPEQYQEALSYAETVSADQSCPSFFVKAIADAVAAYEAAQAEKQLIDRQTGEMQSGVAALITLMNNHKLKNIDLMSELGSASLVSQILNGKRALTVAHMHALAKRFNVPPATFL
ncbi:type II toxin-antitoxin system HigA family antitoxin [Cronobacter sakazakii]|nr:transcriptional regulator [Cronobacter sakazakii]EJV9557848.1 transcriptional regulator [Cronobacter sakazakii]EJV9561903.1 transcriptional regulator [Cronobacter sakazakii]EJX1223097.1 transcriptional regulator [Cronobacter sakazakii]EJX4594312.1 transcriptional regulator [Cronobacter sakazakii]